MTTVTVTLAGTKPARPPIITLLVDVQLKNDDKAPRWALIPSKLPVDSGGIDKLEQLTAQAGGMTVAVGRFLGTGGRYAVRLAPGARVALRKLPIAWWRDDTNAKDVTFDVQLATDVKLGGEAMSGWFSGDPTIGGAVDVDMEAAKHTASHRAPDDKEQPVDVVGAAATRVKLGNL
jgi:hypothetical protein